MRKILFCSFLTCFPVSKSYQNGPTFHFDTFQTQYHFDTLDLQHTNRPRITQAPPNSELGANVPSCSDIRNPSKTSLRTEFCSCLSSFPVPKSSQNDSKFHFNTFRPATHTNRPRIAQAPLNSGFRCENLKAPPAKVDIATAVLTFTAKAVWADSEVKCLINMSFFKEVSQKTQKTLRF